MAQNKSKNYAHFMLKTAKNKPEMNKRYGAGGAPRTPSSGALHLFNGFISHGLGTSNNLLFDLAVKDCYISALTLDVLLNVWRVLLWDDAISIACHYY